MKPDLRGRRTPGELVAETFAAFRAHATVFFTMSLILVAPVTIAVDGVWGRALADGADASIPPAATYVAVVLQVVIVAPLAIALHAVCLIAMARGEEPHLRTAFAAARPAFGRAIGAQVLAALGILAGFALVVLPGVYLTIRWYLASVAATLEGLGPADALRRSGALVQDRWWATLGRILLTALALLVITLAGQLLAVASGSGVLFVSLLAVTQAVAISLSAIFVTLLFFDLDARMEKPA